ncbi:hypothetical protein LCGC14_2182150 [marine sediment metagenome]|uniref:Uncharacterized protein n=1 Tax=marine sediment metagenome TaxID=412755 RepID=A0A0F9GHS4_9ZZZZ
MSENKNLVYIGKENMKRFGCFGGFFIKETKVKEIEKELIQEFLDDLDPESDHELIEKWEARRK